MNWFEECLEQGARRFKKRCFLRDLKVESIMKNLKHPLVKCTAKLLLLIDISKEQNASSSKCIKSHLQQTKQTQKELNRLIIKNDKPFMYRNKKQKTKILFLHELRTLNVKKCYYTKHQKFFKYLRIYKNKQEIG